MSMRASWRQSWQEASAPLRQRWLLLQPREQRALVLLAGAFAVFLLWALWLGSHRAAQKAETQLSSGRALLRELQAAQPASGGGQYGGSLLGAASDAAAAAGLSLHRIEPEGDGGVRVWVEKADFNAVARWLATLSAQGVKVQEAQVEKQAEGGVSARIALGR